MKFVDYFSGVGFEKTDIRRSQMSSCARQMSREYEPLRLWQRALLRLPTPRDMAGARLVPSPPWSSTTSGWWAATAANVQCGQHCRLSCLFLLLRLSVRFCLSVLRPTYDNSCLGNCVVARMVYALLPQPHHRIPPILRVCVTPLRPSSVSLRQDMDSELSAPLCVCCSPVLDSTPDIRLCSVMVFPIWAHNCHPSPAPRQPLVSAAIHFSAYVT